MATTSISKSIAAPKKRPRGLTIATVSLINAKVPLGAGAFYGFFIALVVGLIYPVLSKLNFNAYLTSNAVAGLVGAKLNDASSFSALIGLELYGAFYGLIWGGIIGYIAGAALPSTFENGTLDLALARPISRTRYYLELWFSAFLASVIMSLTTLLAVWISALFVQNANIDGGWLIITQLIEFAFMFLASGIGMLFGSFMNASRAAGGAAVGIIGLAYLMNILGGLSSNLSWMQKIEPFYYAQGTLAIATHDITAWYPWVLVIAGLICGVAGLVIFNKRDLPAV